MRRLYLLLVAPLVLASTWVFAAPATQPPRAQVIVLSNSSPHISVIDAETNAVVRTANLPQMTSWTWNTAKNYYDGKNLWLGMRTPATNDVEVVLLDLDALQITHRIPLGQDRINLYITAPSRTGKLFVAKQGSGQLAIIDVKTYTVETTSLAVLETLSFPEKTQPFMLTATPDGRRLWVQEAAGGTLVVNGLTLQPVWNRIPMGQTPINNVFSPDGKLSFTGHNSPVVVASDTQTFEEVWRAQVGVNAQKLGVHPAGTFVYAIVTNEGAVAVLEAATGKLVKRISLGTNPTGIYVRRL